MDALKEILKAEVRKYAGSGRGANLRLFPLLDDENQTYAVSAVDYPVRDETAGIVVLARLEGNLVIIEEDTTDKPLVEALIQQGDSS